MEYQVVYMRFPGYLLYRNQLCLLSFRKFTKYHSICFLAVPQGLQASLVVCIFDRKTVWYSGWSARLGIGRSKFKSLLNYDSLGDFQLVTLNFAGKGETSIYLERGRRCNELRLVLVNIKYVMDWKGCFVKQV